MSCPTEQRLGWLTAIFVRRIVFCLLFLDCAVVIDEHKGTLVGRVGISGSAFVSRAEIALSLDLAVRGTKCRHFGAYRGVVFGQRGFGSTLLLTSDVVNKPFVDATVPNHLLPRSLGPVW